MQTSTHTTTRTHTATWLSGVIMGTIGELLADLGIDASRLCADWAQDEAAVKVWILEQSLAVVVLECHQPGGKVSPVFEFQIAYDYSGEGDVKFMADQRFIARFRAKLERVPYGSSYALICSFNGYHTPQPGWGPAARASTDGLRSTSLGTIGSGPYASASMRYLR
jgi:HORMA domain-containing protein